MLAIDFFVQLQARELLLIIDNPALKSALQKTGFKNIALTGEFDFITNQKPLLWLISDYESQDKMADLWDRAGGIIVQMTESKAGGDTNALLYALDKLLTVNYGKLLAERELAYEKLLTCNQINVHTQEALLTCHIADEVEIAGTETELESGYLYSLAEFFKASLINMESPVSTFRLEGKLAFNGFLHQANFRELKQEVLPVMQHFQNLFQQGGDNYLHFENNCITRLVTGGADVSEELFALCKNKERETNATEFALALFEFSADWRMNTLLHQTVAGIHLGMGMGEKIPFLDFSASDAKLDFLA